MIIIDANHEGEADVNTATGKEYTPTLNRAANIFLPISFGQYGMSVGNTVNGNYIVKVSMKAVRLEGDGHPALGRIVGKKDSDGYGSQSLPKACYNIDPGDYTSNASTWHESYYDSNNNRLTYSYDETTGDFVGYMRVRRSDNDYATAWGVNEVITIGNAEHVYAEGKFDSAAFNSSFAISDIKVDVYDCTSDSPYTMGALVAEDVAPALTAENIDDTSNWAFQHTSSAGRSSHAHDLVRASQYLWSVDGCTGMVHAENATACMTGSHTLTHNARTDTTREYWSCASCSKNFADPYGKEEITDLSATKQMLVLPATGDGSESVFYPVKLNGFENNQWFKFTCKVKCFGDGVPVVSSLYNVYEGTNVCETTVSTSNDGDFSFFESSFDPDTGILTGYIKAWIKDSINKGSRYPYERYNPISGANCAIVIGNGRYVGTGYADDSHTTGFTITEPALYKISGATTGGTSGLADAKTKPTTGDNLLAPVTDKTVNFDDAYVATWTNANNPLSAPIGKWYRTGSKSSRISSSDIPAGFYEDTTESKMLEIRGLKDNSNSRYFMQKQLFLDSEKTYQFDADYRAFGGFAPYINVNYHTGGSWTELARSNETDNGAHISFRFTTPAGLRTSGDGNFMLKLGLPYGSSATASAYFTNVKVTSVNTGINTMMYGNFAFSDAGTLTTENTDSILPGWENASAFAGGYYKVAVRDLPDDLFDSANTLSGDSTIALKVPGQDYIEPQFKVRLKAGKYYKFSYDYRNVEDAPEFLIREDTVTVTKISSNSGGKYRATYEIYNSGSDNNVRFNFAFGAAASSKTLYIGNVQLYELSGGSGSATTGANIVGNLNPILDDSVYSGVTAAGTNLTLNQDNATNITRDLANGWFIGLLSGEFTDDAQLVKVPADFFNYLDAGQRLELIRKVILGQATSDGINPHYNPNNDAVWGDVKDLVHSKMTFLYNADKSVSITEHQIKSRLASIDKPNDSSGYVSGGTSYYVSNSGNDNNTGTTAETALATINKANTKASAGDTVYLERGGRWYTPSSNESAEQSFTLKSGVHYAAYGYGKKPELVGSLKNYGGSENSGNWHETSSGSHVWYYQYRSDQHSENNAGMIYFIDGDGTVHPGKSIAKPVKSGNTYLNYSTYTDTDLDSDLEYFAPYKSGSNTITTDSYANKNYIYVYSTSNPATRFPEIMIALSHHVVKASNGTDNSDAGITTMNNIAVKYGGAHGVNSESNFTSNAGNVWLKKCEIAYIGGAIQYGDNGPSRLGNGVQFGNGFVNGRVTESYIHDCFDAGVTFQSYDSGSTAYFSYMYFCDNVIENCSYNIEFFMNRSASDKMWQIHFDNNILRNAGYGWGSYDRDDGGLRMANICGSKNVYMTIDSDTCTIKDNVFDCTRSAHVMWTWDNSKPNYHENLTVSGNTYIQKKGAMDGRVMAYGPIGGSYRYASDKASLAAAVATFDTNPNAVVWLGDIG